MPDLLLEFEALEPITLSTEAVVSNEVGTADYLTATALRGSCFQFLRQSGRASEADAWLGLAGPLWSPAWPAENQSHWTIPSPKAFLRDKLHPRLSGCLRNSLFPLPEPVAGAAAHAVIQWTRLGVRWLAVDPQTGAIQGPVQTRIESAMHAGLHYGRQSHRTSALHSRAAISPGSRFRALLRNAPSDRLNGQWVIGKRRSAGNGLMQVTVTGTELPAWMRPSAETLSREVVVQLLSDAVVPGPHGGRLRGLDEAAWKNALGVDAVTVPGAASTSRVLSQWSTAWGFPREQEVVIDAGSCWRISSQCPIFPEKLAALAADGLGLRRQEGFGRVAVNPPWLRLGADGGTFACRSSTANDSPLQGPIAWPGLEQFAVNDLAALVGKAAATAQKLLPTEAKPLVSPLENYAARAENAERVRRYLQGLAERSNPGAWKELAAELKDDLDVIQDLRLVQFYLLCLSDYVAVGQRRNPGGAHAGATN